MMRACTPQPWTTGATGAVKRHDVAEETELAKGENGV